MDPVPYEIKGEDVDEVLSAYESAGGGEWTEERRSEARQHVMRHVLELDETVRTAPEDRRHDVVRRAGPVSERPGDSAPDRREMALAAIEDLLIRDGFLEADPDEPRTFPIVSRRDD